MIGMALPWQGLVIQRKCSAKALLICLMRSGRPLNLIRGKESLLTLACNTAAEGEEGASDDPRQLLRSDSLGPQSSGMKAHMLTSLFMRIAARYLNHSSPVSVGSHFATTNDALIRFEACLSGHLYHVRRRPHERERNSLICSGYVFIYEENISGIKRWDRWSDMEPKSSLRQLIRLLGVRQAF